MDRGVGFNYDMNKIIILDWGNKKCEFELKIKVVVVVDIVDVF